jgi:hypothetical protein
MSKAARSMMVFGVYLVVIGLGFLVVPNMPLGLFGLADTSEPYIRIVGMLLLILAYYYIRAARAELTPLFLWSVHARATVILFFIAFAILDLAEPVLILFGVVDLAAAVWTYLALRNP